MAQEADGPPGALILAKTLARLGLEDPLAIEEDSVEVLRAGAEVLDLECRTISSPVGRPFSRAIRATRAGASDLRRKGERKQRGGLPHDAGRR